MTALQRWLSALAAVAVTVTISYLWVDRPLALIAYDRFHVDHRQTLEPLTHIPDPLIPAAVIAFIAVGLWVLAGRPLAKFPAVVVVGSLSLTMAAACKNELKFVFGRTWPETWINNNPSFIHNGVYGFNWFHGGDAFQSFPSGHMTAMCALISVLWLCYPRLKPLYVLAVVAVAVGLVGADFHFLSDVIAGGFVGTSIGWMATALFELISSKHLAGGERSMPGSSP